MSSCHYKPKMPTKEQLATMKDRYEVCGSGLVVKREYHCGPAVGETVGCVSKSTGYLGVGVLGRYFYLHHAVWFLTYNRWPERPIDHIDGDKTNNSPENLRLSDPNKNMRAYQKNYGAIGYRGVGFHKASGKYRARAYLKGNRVDIGYYDTAEEAAIARDLKCYKDFGYLWEGLNEIGQEYILKHHPEWLDE